MILLRYILVIAMLFGSVNAPSFAQKEEKQKDDDKIEISMKKDDKEDEKKTEEKKEADKKKGKPDANASILYGTASYYANFFHGRQTANGEIFQQDKLTAACNVLPLNTWIRVTNLRNGRSVLVKVNDRLHPRMTRIVDLSRAAATQLGFIRSGLTRVKVEVLGKKKPEI